MPRLHCILLAAALVASSIQQASAQRPAATVPPDVATLEARVDSVVHADILAHGFPSVSIVIARGGETLLERAWGVADRATGRKATPATTYRIGSVAKQFTAAMVMQLVDRGRVAIADSIARHVAGLPPEWNAITIEQLLSHTAGLAPDFREMPRMAQPLPSDSLLAMAVRSGLRSTPGTSYGYSNTGYLLLAVLLERLHDKPYARILEDEIARPLGLASLRFCDSPAGAQAATGHTRTSAGPIAPTEQHPSQGIGYDAICSTAGDLARWNQALHSGRVVSRASYAAMTTTRGAAEGKYGFGLVPQRAPWGSPAIVHGGESAGLSGHNGWFPAESLSVTLLYNALPRPRVDMAEFIGTIALGGTPRPVPPMPVVTLPEAATPGEGRPKFVGAYELRLGAVFIVSFEDGSLQMAPPNGDPQPLFLQSGSTYAVGSPSSKTLVTFQADANGAVTGFVARDGGADRTLIKVK